MATARKKMKEVSRSESLPASSPRERKSATLPANTRPISSSSGEGFFTKLKRCLRIGSKGRYNVNAIQTETLQAQATEIRDGEGQIEKPRGIVARATSLRSTRRSHVDKEDVILIHTGKMRSGNSLFPNRSISETIPEDKEHTFVQIVNGGTPVNTGQTSGAEGGAADIDDVFEMDPGYETLDEIRKKVKLQEAQRAKSQPNASSNVSSISETVDTNASKPNDLGEGRNGFPQSENGRDSGITTPTTESPESGRDSQVRSVTSSMFSDTGLPEDGNLVETIEPEEVTIRGGTMHRLNSCPAETMSKPQRDGQRYSSDSFLTKPLQDETDSDLYANPQILFRKQSKVGQNKSVSASTITVSGGSTKDTLSLPKGLGEKSVSEGDIKPFRSSSVESDTAAPPLPDRRYLESEIRTSQAETDDEHSADNDCSTSTTLSANQDLSQSATHDSVASISSIKEAGVGSSDNLKTPEAESPQTVPVVAQSSSSSGTSDGSVGTALLELDKSSVEASSVVPFPSTEPPSEFISGGSVAQVTLDLNKTVSKSDESDDRIMLISAGSTPKHNPYAFQSHPDINIFTDDASQTCNNIIKSLSCEVISKQRGEETMIHPEHNTSHDRTEVVEVLDILPESFQCAQSNKSEEAQHEESSMPNISQSLENIPMNQSEELAVVDQNECGAQNPSLNLQTDEGCESSPSDSCLERITSDLRDASDVGSESILESNSVQVVERRDACNSKSSDPSCTRDNVVVIKLHESTHEDSLTGEEMKSEEGVSDESIARLEEKAALLQLGSSGKDLHPDLSKVKDLSSGIIEATSSKCETTDFSDDVEGAETSPRDIGQNGSVATKRTVEPIPRPRLMRSRKKEEPIHMTLAEVMNSQEETEDGWESDDDDDDYQDLTEDEGQNGERQGAAPAAAAEQTSQNSTAAAHRAFLESMRQLKDCGWYWGPLSYSEAMSKLYNKPDGSFLVRDSSNENYILSLSFKCMGSVCHTRIEHNKGVFSFWSQPDSHGTSTIKEFIEQAVRFSHTGKFLYFLRPSGPGSPPIAIRLLYPVSRFCRVPSLQHMCRFLILRRVRRDHIDVLPVPEKVKDYLRENQYYVETLDED